MPWLCEEVPGWCDMSEQERDEYRAVIRELGMELLSDDDEDGYYE
jgi:hypothetical protein